MLDFGKDTTTSLAVNRTNETSPVEPASPAGGKHSPTYSTDTSDNQLDRTFKLYIGGAQKRSESGSSSVVKNSGGFAFASLALAGRKDVRNGVDAAAKAFDGFVSKGKSKAHLPSK